MFRLEDELREKVKMLEVKIVSYRNILIQNKRKEIINKYTNAPTNEEIMKYFSEMHEWEVTKLRDYDEYFGIKSASSGEIS